MTTTPAPTCIDDLLAEIEADFRACYESHSGISIEPAEAVGLIEHIRQLERDAARLDWLEAEARRSSTGISIDHMRYVEDGQVVANGYRFMRRRRVTGCFKTARAAIDAAIQEAKK